MFTSTHPVAVGTNPIDAKFGWLRSTTDTGNVTIDQIRTDLLKLQTLVFNNNDTVDSQLMAKDMLSTDNFVPHTGGSTWHFKAPDGLPNDAQPTVPTDAQAQGLRDLNALQVHQNAVLREQDYLKGELFATWWMYMADRNSYGTDELNARYQTGMSTITTGFLQRIRNIYDEVDRGSGAGLGLITDLQTQIAAKKAQLVLFYMQHDPTLLIAGLSSQWPADWDQDLKVRPNPQASINPPPSSGFPAWSPFTNDLLFGGKIPTVLSSAMTSAMGEGLLRDDQWAVLGTNSNYYHNGDTIHDAGVWKNGWFPLFVEREVEYYHVPFESWEFVPQGSEARIGYSLKAEADPASVLIQNSYRILKGMHVNPLQWTQQYGLVPTDDALTVGAEIGFVGKADIMLMAGHTSKTPFASLIDIPAQRSPFKACTHGQFRFTKLNIIDKFGQIVRGVQPYTDLSNAARPIGPTATPLFPCLGDFYSVDQNVDGTAKIVLPRTDTKCNFGQLPPSINQDARINASFLKEDIPSTWRQLDEWENPIRGWLVINPANVSVQVFTPDGRFVREFGVASQNPMTRPFAVDTVLYNTIDPVLKGLLTKFADQGYLAGFFRSITETTETTQANPTSYAESMLRILGRPLALTVFGINLELANPMAEDRSTANQRQIGRIASDYLTSYNFGLKIGDKDNIYDGLYGLFTAAPSVDKGVLINYSDYYTYHTRSILDEPIPNGPSRSMPTISPFYPDPHATNFAQERMRNTRVFAGIIDPFTPISLTTSLLPMKQLKLPAWTIDAGLKSISAFFKMGPFLIPQDVAPFDNLKEVAADYRLDDAATAPASNGTVPIPSVGLGD
ncbi:uncharacterized protein KY384_000098 [Bacidia gigantensis]|uniref:uncharacterized protein n=1 Tax=Bacidia gigantensis TaxID=2732470 RepID=UPI001D03E6E8|nr:uncharacterized protein KY384_000098 [Bacidia gigantensis]KAG8526105.1 hypothetical protein KY384_000098 [Bacidia gigantensis]